MKHHLALILCSGLLAPIYSQNSLTDINPKTFFKPKLDRASRARTGIILRTVKSRPPVMDFNNPFLSRSSDGRVSLSNSFNVTIQNQRYAPNSHGKVEAVPLKPDFYEIEWEDSGLKRTTFLPIQSSEIWLLEFLRTENHPMLPSVLVGKTILESLPNPELNQLHQKLIQLASILKTLKYESFDPEDYVADSYTDDIGGKKDFAEYLRIKLKTWQEITFSSSELIRSGDIYRLYLNGNLRNRKKESNYFFLRLDLLDEFKVRRFELISGGQESD